MWEAKIIVFPILLVRSFKCATVLQMKQIEYDPKFSNHNLVNTFIKYSMYTTLQHHQIYIYMGKQTIGISKA